MLSAQETESTSEQHKVTMWPFQADRMLHISIRSDYRIF